MKIKIAYFGTPDFSAYLLEKILKDKDLPIEIKLVVTQPDKPVGRRKILTPSLVKQVAKKYGLKVWDKEIKFQAPSTNNQTNSNDQIQNSKQIKNCQLALLYAFGRIIPKDLIGAPKHGFWNIHPSLLPQYRGASPIAYPLMLGDKVSGVTIIKMDERLDHGPIIAQEKYQIGPIDRRPDLEIKLTDLAYEMTRRVILNLVQDLRSRNKFGMTTRRQNHQLATYTRRLKRDDGFVSLSPLKKALKNEPLVVEELPSVIKEYLANYPKLIGNLPVRQAGWKLGIGNSPKIIFDYFRGLFPWPGVWTYVVIKNKKLRLKLTDVDLVDAKLMIKKVQLEGKKEVDFSQFNQAYQVFS